MDGLRIAGGTGVEAVRKVLDEEEAGEVFLAGLFALERGDAGDFGRAREIAEADTDVARGLISALAWCPTESAQPAIRELLAGSPTARRIGLRASAAHGVDPGDALRAGLAAAEPELRAAALRAVGELARVEFSGALAEATRETDHACAFWAAWSQALLGLSLEPLITIAASDHPGAERAAALALRRLDPQRASQWIDVQRADPARQRVAVIGAGASGDPRWIPWLIELTADADLARLAAEAFATVAGADIDEDHLDGDPPPPRAPASQARDGEGTATDADPDEAVEPDEETDAGDDRDAIFEWPDRYKIEQWWSGRRASFRDGTRYLWGAPIDAGGVARALAEARQTVRLAAALERAQLDGGRPLFAARALAARQRSWLGLATF